MTSTYVIKKSVNVYIQLFTPQVHSTYEAQISFIKSLVEGWDRLGIPVSIRLLKANDTKPAGCVARVLDANAVCYLLIKEDIDIDAKIEKAKTMLVRARQGVYESRKIVDWLEKAGKIEEKVAVWKWESKKVEDGRREIWVLEESEREFERLKLE